MMPATALRILLALPGLVLVRVRDAARSEEALGRACRLDRSLPQDGRTVCARTAAAGSCAPALRLWRSAGIFAMGVAVAALSAFGGVNPSFVALALVAAIPIPALLRRRRMQRDEDRFSADFPTALFATASALRAGLSLHDSLYRAVALLPADSGVRLEIEQLLARLRTAMPRDAAISAFGARAGICEAEPFKIAVAIALEHGGRFGDTLQRLACVSSDRRALVEAAKVSTASMRMTAHVLLSLTPVLLALQYARSSSGLNAVLDNPVSLAMAVTGSVMIAGGYLGLCHLGNFRP